MKVEQVKALMDRRKATTGGQQPAVALSEVSAESEGVACLSVGGLALPPGGEYVITGAITGYEDGRLTGECYARACTCPDFKKRQGPDRDKLRGEARCCKHMRLLLAMAHLWQGQLPWVGGVAKEHLLPGEGWILREF